jgi:hypothetical protein
MFSYKPGGAFVTLKSDGKADARQRQAVYDAMRSDPRVPDGTSLILDLRLAVIQLTQSELVDRVRALFATLGPTLGSACAVIVKDKSLRFGLNLQTIAGNMNFRVGIFHDEDGARKWLTADAASH